VLRSIPLAMPREFPSLVVDPSAPTTKEANTAISKGYRAKM
jgi:hypothetical protein